MPIRALRENDGDDGGFNCVDPFMLTANKLMTLAALLVLQTGAGAALGDDVALEKGESQAQNETALKTEDVPEAHHPGVAWYADWEAGLAEAERSQRAILLQFARPACRGVSGVF